MAAERPRCSFVSLSLGEPQFATASTVTRWLLLEQPGPWGRDALSGSRLPPDVARDLHRRSVELGVRVILIRRPGRSAPNRRDCFLAYSGEDAPWLSRVPLDDVRDVLALDLEPLANGRRGTGDPVAQPIYVVCTHGRRDPCCAERGRPLARAVEAAVAERAWEASHIGGDRFAGNVVCFPHGVYYGRVAPHEAARVVRAHDDRRIDLDRYRGRSCYDFPTQAAEHFIRRDADVRGLDDLRLVRARRTRHEFVATFARRSGTELTARLRVGRGEPRRLTCHAQREVRLPEFELIDLRSA